MSKTRDTGYLANVIQVHDTGVRIMSGSEMLMAISSSGQVTITGELSGSDAANALLLSGTGSVGFTTTSSFLAVSSSQQEVSASYISLSGSYNTFSGSASTRITENSSSIQQVSSSQQQISSSLLQVSASYISLSGSYNTFSGSASTRITTISSSQQDISSSQQQISASLLNVIAVYATTGSNSFRATQSITGSLTVTGQIIAQTINVQQVTSSIIYSSGSNVFGCDLNSRQTFTGSVLITGSLTIAGASSATSYSGTTIYGSTAVCSPVGKFTTCIDAGTGTFSGALSGTCATFSSKLYADGNVRAAYLDYVPSGTETFVIGKASYNVFDGNQLAMGTFTALPIEFATNNVKRLTISSTGIASFTCQVCAGSFYTTGNSCFGGKFSVNTAIDSEAQVRINAIGNTTDSITCSTALRLSTSNNTAGQGVSIALTAGTTKETGIILAAENTSGQNGDFLIRTYSGGANYPERMRITGAGCVGVGRCCVEFTLDINGDIALNRQNRLHFASSNVGDRCRSFLAGDYNNNIFVCGPSGNAIAAFMYTGTVCTYNLLNAAGGVKFANGSSTINYYEEGTFTPTIQGSSTAGTGTYSHQIGVYTKIGNLVTINVWINWSAHTGTGNVLLANFPFTSIGTSNYRASGTFGWLENLTLSASNVATMAMNPSSTTASITQYPVGGGAASGVPMDTAANLHYALTYQTT